MMKAGIEGCEICVFDGDMMNHSYSDYDIFYLSRNEATLNDYERHCRGFERKLSGLLAGCENRKVLDVGCGCGFLLYFLRRKGFTDLTGVDLNERLISIAKSYVNARFVVADGIEYLQSERQKYDIIFLWNVLEHISHDKVQDALMTVHSALADNGFLVVRTPNMTNIMAQGSFCDDFTHLSGFTEQSIVQVACLAGFRSIEMLNQFKMRSLKGKLKALINFVLHKFFLWLRGGTKCRVFYKNLYVVMHKN